MRPEPGNPKHNRYLTPNGRLLVSKPDQMTTQIKLLNIKFLHVCGFAVWLCSMTKQHERTS